jgi:hypothetical protein
MEEETIEVMLPWHWHKGKGKPRCCLCFGAVEDIKGVWRSDEDKKRLRFTAYCPYCDSTLELYCGASLQMIAILDKKQIELYKTGSARRKRIGRNVKNEKSISHP